MSEDMIIKHCSPTLAGLKTGNMFSCNFYDAADMRNTLRSLNRLLGKKGLRILPLRFKKNQALIYVYRPARLSSDLKQDTACRLLKERGYGMESPEHCVMELIKRLDESREFPHEIGLFLGYPPEDVRGFIEHGAEGCKCTGYWKVYGDARAAQELFTKYKRCTDIYCAQHARGRSLEQLTVAG